MEYLHHTGFFTEIPKEPAINYGHLVILRLRGRIICLGPSKEMDDRHEAVLLYLERRPERSESSKCGCKNPHSPDDIGGARAYATGMIYNAQPHRKVDTLSHRIVEVLICDDEPSIREALKSLLSTCALLKPDEPFSKIKVVGEAANGREALQTVAKHQPDVVLMDAQMPVMDGFEAARAIKAAWSQVKVVMLTGYSAQQQAAMATGVDACLLKGCPAEKLIDTILRTSETDSEHA